MKKWMEIFNHALRNLFGPDHPEYYVPTLPDTSEEVSIRSRSAAPCNRSMTQRSRRNNSVERPYRGDWLEERHEDLIQELGDTDGYFDDLG